VEAVYLLRVDGADPEAALGERLNHKLVRISIAIRTWAGSAEWLAAVNQTAIAAALSPPCLNIHPPA
jgi:hypothetical protein